MPFISLLQTAPVAGSSSILMTVLPLALIFVIFYFLMIRPQNKKQKETEKMIAALKKGDKIVTIGGIHGVVSSTKEQTVIVKIDDAVKMEFSRSAIATVVAEKNEKIEKSTKASKSKKDIADNTEAKIETEEEQK